MRSWSGIAQPSSTAVITDAACACTGRTPRSAPGPRRRSDPRTAGTGRSTARPRPGVGPTTRSPAAGSLRTIQHEEQAQRVVGVPAGDDLAVVLAVDDAPGVAGFQDGVTGDGHAYVFGRGVRGLAGGPLL